MGCYYEPAQNVQEMAEEVTPMGYSMSVPLFVEIGKAKKVGYCKDCGKRFEARYCSRELCDKCHRKRNTTYIPKK